MALAEESWTELEGCLTCNGGFLPLPEEENILSKNKRIACSLWFVLRDKAGKPDLDVTCFSCLAVLASWDQLAGHRLPAAASSSAKLRGEKLWCLFVPQAATLALPLFISTPEKSNRDNKLSFLQATCEILIFPPTITIDRPLLSACVIFFASNNYLDPPDESSLPCMAL